MTKDKAVKDDTFFISLAENDKPYTIPKLLRHAMATLENIAGNTPVYINCLLLEAPYSDDVRPSLMVSYWNISDRDDRHNFGPEAARQSDKILNVTCLKTAPYSLSMIEYRLPQGRDQANTILLIKNIANHLEGEAHTDIIDLIYHDHMDEDGNSQPFVRVYFSQAKDV